MVLGSTGSVGVSTLDVISRHRDRFVVVALSAHTNVELLFKQCCAHKPRFAVTVNEDAASALSRMIERANLSTRVLHGVRSLARIASLEQAEIVMAAIVGAAGLLPALEAVRSGKRVLFANKEPLVMLGGLFVAEARRSGATILPIDSEHNAIFQCLPESCTSGIPLAEKPENFGVKKIILTASGGPFREFDLEELDHVSPQQACTHPNWVMGKKISVDSATMMNKGLELIEAAWLFNAQPKNIEIVIHRQSIVHSLVEYVDGSVLAQLASPDMRIPIAHALAWPDRMSSGADALNLCRLGTLDFEPPSLERFPCLSIAQHVASEGGTAPAIANAANEVAVEAFLEGKIRFTAIPILISETVERVAATREYDLESVLEADKEARFFARSQLRSKSRRYGLQTKQVNLN